jgi:drug/metabolite transporter (DMT)-like permease
VFGTRLSRVAVGGLAVGLGGVALLVSPGAGGIDILGGLACVGCAASWAAGSLYSRHAALPSQSSVASGMEMLAGGVLLAAAGLAAGEGGQVHLSHVSTESWLALAYLVVVGSIVAFSAFHWLLHNAPMHIVSTYAYVNPVVAVLLGAAFLGEPMTLRTLVAGLAIVASVVLIVGARMRVPRLRGLVPARSTA